MLNLHSHSTCPACGYSYCPTCGLPAVEKLPPAEEDDDAQFEFAGFSVRSYNTLKNNNINTLSKLSAKTPRQLLKLKGFGRYCLREVQRILSEHRLALREDGEVA